MEQALYWPKASESYGARRGLYLLSGRIAQKLKAGPAKIREWFAELEHYGFVGLHSPIASAWTARGRLPIGA